MKRYSKQDLRVAEEETRLKVSNMERVLVTGGAGFIGSHLVDRLVEDHDVVVLDDLTGGSLSNIQEHIDKKGITFINGSITSEDTVKQALDGVTTVFHFAAQPDIRLSTAEQMTDFNVNMNGGMVKLCLLGII